MKKDKRQLSKEEREREAKLQKEREENEILEEAIRSNVFELTFNRRVFYFLVGHITAFLPSYLFQGVLDLDFAGYSIALYVIISSIVALILSIGYHKYFLRTRPKLTIKHEAILSATAVGGLTKQQKEEIRNERPRLTELGATAYAIFFGNTVFLVTVMILSFYFLKNADVRVNYTLSMIAAAGLSTWLSTSKPRNKKKK